LIKKKTNAKILWYKEEILDKKDWFQLSSTLKAAELVSHFRYLVSKMANPFTSICFHIDSYNKERDYDNPF
jgi:hypothetical protein